MCSNDNGGLTEESNRPFRGTKNTTFEGGVRVPCIVHWPGKTTPGAKSDAMMHITDCFSTFVNLAGGEVKAGQDRKLDSIDMTDTLFAGAKPPREEIVFEVTGSVRVPTIRSGDYKLMGELLFNIAEDPSETTDIAKQHPEIVNRLTARLEAVSAERPPLGDKPLLMTPALPYVYGMQENKDVPQWLKDRVDAARKKQPQHWPEGKTPWPKAPQGVSIDYSKQ
jgi:arylsulfatase A-like enzyme